MKRYPTYLVLSAVTALLLVGVLACGSTDLTPVEDRIGSVEQNVTALQGQVADVEGKAGHIAVAAGVKEFQITGVEWKGTTNTDDLAPPGVDPADLSDGYGFNPPGFDSSNPKNWRVATYTFVPGSMIAYEGDRIDLNFFIINGNKHETWVEAPDGSEVVAEWEMNRGREYQKSFTASQPGIYQIICNTHEPTMTASILVVPRI